MTNDQLLVDRHSSFQLLHTGWFLRQDPRRSVVHVTHDFGQSILEIKNNANPTQDNRKVNHHLNADDYAHVYVVRPTNKFCRGNSDVEPVEEETSLNKYLHDVYEQHEAH